MSHSAGREATRSGSRVTAETRAPLRRDTARTRDLLLDAVGDLLDQRGVGFSLPDLARASGIGSATVYRHFGTVNDAHQAFYYRLVDQLVAELEAITAHEQSQARFEKIGQRWAALAIQWGRAATRIRSSEGFLERVAAGDHPTSALHAALAPVIDDLITSGLIPPQDRDYAVLLWVTLFDERVIIDLASQGWTTPQIARALSASLICALQARPN